MNFVIHTLGCKVNIYESEYIINQMENAGYKMVNSSQNADIYIINSCSVTNEADKKDRKLIHNIRKNHQDAILIVMGCYSQLNPNEIDADIIIGNIYKSKIVDLIEEYLKDKKPINKVEDITKIAFEDMYINRFTTHTRGFVKIQDGCNAFCTYCTIPYARGGLRSKDASKVIKEVTALVENGYREIVLTGIHTGKYGINTNYNLESLLKELVKIPNILRIRLSSIEINEITDGIIELIKNNDIMAKHLHIPLQSGSDFILKEMNRHYNVEFFINKINHIRQIIPDISITTDLIVGFPGETEELFKETINTIDQIKFTKIHTFPYSKRSGTVSSNLPLQIDTKIKKCRVKEVINLSNKYENLFYQSKLNAVYDGIVENRKDGTKIVITTNYIPVRIQENLDNNQIVSVKITKIDGLNVFGRLIAKNN